MSSTIRASIIDGIARTPRYRENCLAVLHQTLESKRREILEVLSSDAQKVSAEAKAGFLLTQNAIKTFHDGVDPKALIQEEYQVAKGKDHATRRMPYGYAYVLPSPDDLFYSTIVPVAAALAAGNCILVENAADQSKAAVLVKTVLTQALPAEIFAFVDQDPFDKAFAETHRVLVRGSPGPDAEVSPRTIGRSPGLVVAIVERGCDLKTAALECVQARFGFGGRSSYGPDVVLVNEFCLEAFAAEVLTAALGYMVPEGMAGSASASTPKVGKSYQGASNEVVLASGERGKVVVAPLRNTDTLAKVTTSILKLVPVSSVDACIDTLSGTGSRLQALYVYAPSSTAKYVAQFINSDLSLINHISPELLIGPPAPSGFLASVHPRYSVDMFSFPAPCLVEINPQSKQLAGALWPKPEQGDRKSMENVIETTLVPVKEGYGPSVGFFEQGLLFGVSVVLSMTIVGCALGIRYVYPAVVVRLRTW